MSIFLAFSFSNHHIRIPGDINNDGVVNILDVIELVNIILFNSGDVENGDLGSVILTLIAAT